MKHVVTPKKLVANIFDRMGYEIRLKNINAGSIVVRYPDEYAGFINIIRDHTMVAPTGLATLYEQALHCEEHEAPGAFVECGVWKGGAIGLMALVNLAHGSVRRNIHLFDAFQEICEPDETVDGERALREVREWATSAGTKGRLVPLKGVYDHKGGPGTLEDNKKLLEEVIGYDSSYIHYHAGWFQDTMPAAQNMIGDIAILRLDADWYASTKICLDYLFDKVVPGGFVIIDDYGAYDGCKKAVDEFIAKNEKPLYLNYVNRDIRYIIIH